jgi:hypothetical protein
MKYVLYIPSIVKKMKLKINKTDFIELKKAKEFLNYIFNVEESYDILISNYVEFEQEILKLTLQNMIFSDYTSEGFYELKMLLNKRLINLLSSVKLYQDLVKHQIPGYFEDRKKFQNRINNLFATEYDNNEHYKFMEELRKFTQHAGLAIHLTIFNMKRTNLEKNYQIEYSINFASYSDKLKEDKMFNLSKFSKIEEKIDLKIATRHYVQSISIIHESTRKLFEEFAEDYRKVIESAHSKFGKYFNCNTDYLTAGRIEDNTIQEKFTILLDWDNVRIKLQQKNKKLIKLDKSYITSIINSQETN